MAAPYARNPVELILEGELVSQPYVDMTLAVMAAFGATVQRQPSRFLIPAGQRYRGRAYAVEPDASAAGYFSPRRPLPADALPWRACRRKVCKATSPFANACSRWAVRWITARTRARHERSPSERPCFSVAVIKLPAIFACSAVQSFQHM